RRGQECAAAAPARSAAGPPREAEGPGGPPRIFPKAPPPQRAAALPARAGPRSPGPLPTAPAALDTGRGARRDRPWRRPTLPAGDRARQGSARSPRIHRERQRLRGPPRRSSRWQPRSAGSNRALGRAAPETPPPADLESEAPARSRSQPAPKADRARSPPRPLGAPPGLVERHLLAVARRAFGESRALAPVGPRLSSPRSA